MIARYPSSIQTILRLSGLDDRSVSVLPDHLSFTPSSPDPSPDSNFTRKLQKILSQNTPPRRKIRYVGYCAAKPSLFNPLAGGSLASLAWSRRDTPPHSLRSHLHPMHRPRGTGRHLRLHWNLAPGWPRHADPMLAPRDPDPLPRH